MGDARRVRLRWLIALPVLLLAVVIGWRLESERRAGARHPRLAAQPVTAARAHQQSVAVWLTALGTVTPRSLVNVMPRVSGLLQSVHYRQGQKVTAGELLAQIDPRPFEITVAQDRAQLAQTRAQLAGARRDLARYEILLKQDSIAAQQVADERATVDGLEAAEQMNAAVLANARLQLQWTRITAPVSGVVGLRLVDAGNMVTTAGAVGSAAGSGGATPIATIAQIQPVDVTFALPQQDIGSVVEQLGRGRQLPAQAYNARNTRLLAAGVLIAADNQINASTGTLLLRARFRNTQFALFPNQFVNVRLLVRTIPNAVVVPTTAVGVGALGSYVYVIQHDHKARLQSVQTGVSAGPLTQIISGLVPGDTVATDGLDRLRNGAQVRLVQAAPNATQRARSTRAAQPR